MESGRVPYEKILFVCTNVREEGACCGKRDSQAIRDALKEHVKTRGLSHKIRVSQSGCQDQCRLGPNVMVFPGYRWYRHVTLDDVPKLIEAELTSHSSLLLRRDASAHGFAATRSGAAKPRHASDGA